MDAPMDGHVWVCDCCLFALVNGDGCQCGDDATVHPNALGSLLSDVHATPDYCADHYERDGEPCANCEETRDDDGHATFSGSWCDGCGTGLAGERWQFAIYERA